MKKQLLLAFVGTALLAPWAAQAEGAYVGVNVGRAEQKASIAEGSLKDNSTGYKLYGGYALNQNFGLEGGYVDLGKASVSSRNGAVTSKISSKPNAFYLAATGTLPLNDQFSLFAKLGVSLNHTKIHFEDTTGANENSSKRRTTALIGIGAAYNISKEMALVAEYEDFGKIARADGLDLKANLFSIGLRYKF
ncbi:outer membrane beta-barrel protein [Polaromonas sp. UC242_47]|uniref:outer membrane beta-barrel protein n=1 Tax=Polaromonas sp. UC242_47 TaxID=3374626 RepID=UPI0037B93FEA